MSIKTFEEALDFMPDAARASARPARKGFWSTLIQALADGRSAEAEYRRQIARGVDSSVAIKSAFNVGFERH